MYMLVDCNNFYASCERVFNPRLNNQPIVVLSNNDGCIIARSNEAKHLGIKMGQPFFEVKALCQTKKVYVFSSNYALYGDMSNRVMALIEENWDEVEIYSIDEAFLKITGLSTEEIKSFSLKLSNIIFKSTGIPVSIGVGQTKTLAKCANYIAKKKLKSPYFDISHQKQWLKKVEVSSLWGIGRQWAKRLNTDFIFSAEELRRTPPELIRQRYNITLSKTVRELQGEPCFLLESPSPRKSIMSSRSFDKPQTSFDSIAGALSRYCDLASAKLREQCSVAARISVFVSTNPFKTIEKQYRATNTITLLTPSDDIRVISSSARQCFKALFKEGFQYKKVGVSLEDLRENTNIQLSLWQDVAGINNEQSKKLMKMYDSINQRYGRNTIKLASNQQTTNNNMRSFYRSPRYTTCWQELLAVRLN